MSLKNSYERLRKKLSKPERKPRIIAVLGPTASGKTALGIRIAEKYKGEIISADSRQIYRGMDIGTAKPSKAEMRIVSHHLIDSKDPNEDYTVSDYKADAVATINDVLRRGRLPIILGGTGLYAKAVLENLDIPKIKADPSLRKKLEDEIKADGLPALFKKLVALDPEAAYIVDGRNPRRVVRALEVAITTGKPFTAQQTKSDPLFDALRIGIDPGQDILRERIDKRIDVMIDDGLVEEVRSLIKKYGERVAAFDAIGYREIVDYLNSKVSLPEAVAAMKMNTWHYAKRQITWFKKDKNIHWISNPKEADTLVKDFLR